MPRKAASQAVSRGVDGAGSPGMGKGVTAMAGVELGDL